MKLNEVTIGDRSVDISLGGIDPNEVIWTQRKMFTKTGNGLPIYLYSVNGGLRLYTIEGNDRIITLLLLQQVNLKKRGEHFMTRRTWTRPEDRGKGFALELISVLKNKFKFRFVSDTSVTNDGIQLWKGLSRHLPVKALNVDTGEIFPRSEVPDEKIYRKNSTDPENKYLLILEKENGPLDFLPENPYNVYFLRHLRDPNDEL